MDLFQVTKLMDGLSRKGKISMGIDLGAGSTKIVVLSGSLTNPVTKYCGLLSAEIISEENIRKPLQPSQALKTFLGLRKYSSQNIIACVPAGKIISHQIEVQKNLNEDELALIVEAEVQRMMPDVDEKLSIDYCTVEEGTLPSQRSVDRINVCICRRSIVDEIVDAIRRQGVGVRIMDVDTYALRRLFQTAKCTRNNENDDVQVLVQCGLVTLYVLVWHGVDFIYEREITLDENEKFGFAQHDFQALSYW
ncbi:MAG: hypothetical protein GKR96_13230 [Gammaproteobacteria bacterium]|nr:hypothetical protein [Gammaproteobacteria bacterium]